MDYNIIEAFDQPWKTFEGSVGAYWGLFDNAREPKFAWTGADRGCASLEDRRRRGCGRRADVVADPRHGGRDADPGDRVARGGGTRRRRLDRRPCSNIGTAIISSPARRLRSALGMVLLMPAGADRAEADRRDRGVLFGRAPSRLLAARRDAGSRRNWPPAPASRRRCRSTYRPSWSRRTCSRRRSMP